MSTKGYEDRNVYDFLNDDTEMYMGPADGGEQKKKSAGNRHARTHGRKKMTKALAGVLAAGLVAGTAFYGGRVSASSDSTTASNWEAIPNDAETTNVSTASAASGTDTGADSTGNTDNGVVSLTASSDTASSGTDGDLTVTEVAKKGMSSVVAITNTIKYKQNGYQLFGSDSSDGTVEAAASGSGVIIGITDDEVLIVTNHHVIEDASELSVQFVDGTSADASIKGEDSSADLAVIAVDISDLSSDTLEQISAVTFADSDDVEVGEQVVAIGNALGYGQSVTTGIISAKDRDLESSDGTTETGLLQTDAAINPGNSGGALLNMKGQLVGINVAKYSSTDVEGMGYSIPSNKVAEVVAELAGKTTRSVVDESERGYLGITTATIDASVAAAYDMPQGVYVYSITEGSAAADSDLQKGDIITAFDGQNISDADDLSDLLKYYKAGETVTLTVQRDTGSGYEEAEVEVTLGSQQAVATQTSASQASAQASAGSGDESDNSGSGSNGSSDGIGSYFGFGLFR